MAPRGAADVVFTDGAGLHARLHGRRRDVHDVPSVPEVESFARVRDGLGGPADQAAIARPRIGYHGIIDDRIDLVLIDEVAARRPDLQLVLVGPIAVAAERLPRRDNVHWLGARPLEHVPRYVAGWDVAMLPLARAAVDRHVGSTTPQLLAAGRPVVSTSIDVVRPYGEHGLAWIADSTPAFACAIDNALAEDRDRRLARVDRFLADQSWDRTWREMWSCVDAAMRARAPRELARAARL